MIEPTAPPKQAAEKISFEQLLCAVWTSVEEMLDAMPDTSLEARRLITRELSFEPRPEELQAIVKMAEDNTDKGLRRELPRSMLTLRVVAERELAILMGEQRLKTERIELTAELLPRIAQETERLDKRLQSTTESMAGLTVEDRDYLLHVGEALRCPDDAIRVAMLLVPRLLILAERAAADDPSDDRHGLSERELEIVRSTLQGSGECGTQPSRMCINALAVRSIMQDDLRAWEETFSDETADEETLLARKAATERLQADKVAYQFISERLQKKQDMALVAGLTGFADEMREIARSLFAVNLKLIHALKDGAKPHAYDDQQDQIEDAALLEKYRAAEEEGDRLAGKRVSKEEVILKALNKIKDERDEQPELPSLYDPQRERRRIWAMSAVVLLLLISSAFVHLVLLGEPEEYIDASAADFDTTLQLAQVDSIGRMMHTKVLGWAELSELDRIGKVEQLGRQAAAEGFTLVYVIDDNGEPAATWTEESGVVLE